MKHTSARHGPCPDLIQEAEYAFPYHYVPHVDSRGTPWCVRRLSWGFEYLCYVSHVQELVGELAPSSVLEVGCGDGRVIGSLTGSIARRLGVDISERAIGFAKAFHPEIEFRVQDAADLDEEFDLVLAVEVLEHVADEDVTGFLRALAARTRPNGHVLVSVPSIVVPVVKKHHRHYGAALIQRQVVDSGAPLNVVRLDYVCGRSWVLSLYQRLCMNRFWVVQSGFVNRWVWAYVWRRLRHAKENRGRHMVALLRKPP